MAQTKIPSSGLSANLTLTGTTYISGNIVPTTNGTVNLGSPDARFGTIYVSANTIDIGGSQITTTQDGFIEFATATGNVQLNANVVNFLSNVTQGETGGAGYTGSAGADGYTGSRGNTGLGFAIAKSYSSVAALTADTSPTGIAAGQFAIVETGNVNDADNSRLYLWSGTAYSYVTDLSGAAGITGPQGTAGYTGSAGTNGFTGSVGFVGSSGTGFTGSTGQLTYAPGTAVPYILSKTNSAQQSIGSGSEVLINLNTVITGSTQLSNGTDGFSIPRAGVYIVDVQYITNNSTHVDTTEIHTRIFVNGVQRYSFYESLPAFGFNKSINGSAPLYLNSADIVTVYFWAFNDTLIVGASSCMVTVTEMLPPSAGYTGSASTAAGYTGSAGVGFTGSSGSIGFTGSIGVGFTGSTGTAGTQGSIGYTGSAGTGGGGGSGYTGSAGTPGTLASGQVTNTFTGNGVATAFTLTVAPVSEDATTVNIDGVTQQRSSYTVNGFTLTLDEAPLTGEIVEVTITTYGTTNFVTRTYTGNGTTANYAVTLGATVDSVIVTENGVVQTPSTDYTITGNVLSFVGGAPATSVAIGIREIPAGAVGGNSVYSRTAITATAGQTVFAVAYNIGFLEVYFNGALLNSVDYTATTGSTVVLTDAAAVDDIVEFITYNVVPVTAVPVAMFNSTNLTANLAITAGYSAVSVGPISVADGVAISIASGQKWVIL